MSKISIYTDGSSRGNPGPGGWGVVIKFRDREKEISGGEKVSTNNRMELMAVIVGLEAITTDKYPIEVYSDSKYVVDSVNKGWVFNWNKKPNMSGKKNPDLWKRFLEVYSKFNYINFNWVKGHAGHIENERCDWLATNESSKFIN